MEVFLVILSLIPNNRTCWVLCLISIDSKEIRDAMSINK